MPKAILLVEDSDDDLFLFRRALQRSGLDSEVFCVSSGEAALLYLKGEGGYADRDRYPFPSVVFLDLRLPGRSGVDILDDVRREYQSEQLLVIVLSSAADPRAVRAVSALRADGFLAKPPRPDDLRKLASQFPGHF